jgi:hypothetical protein
MQVMRVGLRSLLFDDALGPGLSIFSRNIRFSIQQSIELAPDMEVYFFDRGLSKTASAAKIILIWTPNWSRSCIHFLYIDYERTFHEMYITF